MLPQERLLGVHVARLVPLWLRASYLVGLRGKRHENGSDVHSDLGLSDEPIWSLVAEAEVPRATYISKGVIHVLFVKDRSTPSWRINIPSHNQVQSLL